MIILIIGFTVAISGFVGLYLYEKHEHKKWAKEIVEKYIK